jgi:hypothetical protein
MARYSKFIVAAIAALGVVISSGLLPANVAAWANVVVAAASAALVYLIPNTAIPGAPKTNPPGDVTPK